ncbi:MAG TPA: hypothetical protein VEW48_28405 [Thermoanaerobaculia bacterium]|nr:hypothetical protein [Thermoanaerobaculia bacterium]
MKARKITLERLVGRTVHDPDGRRAGRILEVEAEIAGDDCLIREYRLGAAALLQRLGISAARLMGLPIRHQPLRVPWDQLDLGDPERPRLRCTLEELRALQPR